MQGLVVCRAIPAQRDLAVCVLFVFLPGEYVLSHQTLPKAHKPPTASIKSGTAAGGSGAANLGQLMANTTR